MTGEGVLADGLADIFSLFTKKYGLNQKKLVLSGTSFRRPEKNSQLAFDFKK